MGLFSAMPSHGLVAAVRLVGIAAAILALVGLRGRIALPIAWLSALFLTGMVTSQGKLMENDVLYLIALMPLLPARHCDAWSLNSVLAARPRRKGCYGWLLRTAMVLVSGVYLAVGLNKLRFSGIAWLRSG